MLHNGANVQTENKSGISIKRVTLSDPSQLPKDYGTTPGGTYFSTTPGGTRIIYDRAFLMSRRESPLAKSPPANLPYIPEITLIPPKENNNNDLLLNNKNKTSDQDNIQKPSTKDVPDDMHFEMDI